MTNEELSQTLTRLHEQLSRTEELDDSTVRSLRQLLDEIEAATARSQAAETRAPLGRKVTAVPEDLSLSQRMRKAVEEFEFRHPQLTVSLSQIADSLAEMGF
ncbi:MAG: DUF4404 family protein [Aureliella sp.]